MKKVHIAVLMMVKNEHKRILVTLDSVLDIANSIIIFDTGSTDNTIELCKEFSNKHKIPLRLKQDDFVNFSVSRNQALDFADTCDDIDYILMMDVNDELKGSNILRQAADEFINQDFSVFMIKQEWFSGNISSYFNMRFVKPRKGWRYVGVVHEYLNNVDRVENAKVKILSDSIVLYQDRDKDIDKSRKRFFRDEIMLKNEFIKDPTDSRTVFYLAQTYSCLHDWENAYYYYKIRTTLKGFEEEIYESFFKCGDICEKLGLDWHTAFVWYMKAYELIPRAEPLLKISDYYRRKNNIILSYTFANLACELKYPDNCILFVDKFSYDYIRWHLLAISAYYTGFLEKGKEACIKAIENGIKYKINVDLDKQNLKFYEIKEKETK